MSNPLAELADCTRQLALAPHDGKLWCRVGFLYLQVHEVEEGLNTFLAAQQIAPGQGDAYYGESIARLKLGEPDAALAALGRAMRLAPHDQRLFSAYAYLCQATGQAPETVLAAYRDWARRFAEPLKPAKREACGRRPGNGKIRIGYLSADFRQHALMNFFNPVLEHHDRTQFEIVAFFAGTADERTATIRQRFDHWNDVARLNDAELAALIRRRGIDLLVDLSGHTDGSRLLAVARQPAPVQLTWYGYNGTTGLSAMDGRLTDAVMDPPGNEAWSVEPLVRLPHFACFEPPAEAPEPGPAPCQTNGYVTFGSLNNAQKLSPATLHCWGELLHAVPHSRLLLIGPHAPTAGQALADHLLTRLAASGIPVDRVDLLPQQSLADFLALGRRIDIALEPFPLSGAVTTAQALWLGLPCITLAGRLPAERAAAAILAAAGQPQWIATSTADYQRLAGELAADPARLQEIRAGLRPGLAASPLLDHAGFTRQLEACFRQLHEAARPC